MSFLFKKVSKTFSNFVLKPIFLLVEMFIHIDHIWISEESAQFKTLWMTTVVKGKVQPDHMGKWIKLPSILRSAKDDPPQRIQLTTRNWSGGKGRQGRSRRGKPKLNLGKGEYVKLHQHLIPILKHQAIIRVWEITNLKEKKKPWAVSLWQDCQSYIWKGRETNNCGLELQLCEVSNPASSSTGGPPIPCGRVCFPCWPCFFLHFLSLIVASFIQAIKRPVKCPLELPVNK